MYEIRPESIITFINDRNIKLPRFQRKQTWDYKKNFQLCISLFKEYPLGVCILSIDGRKNKSIRWLLDGRQRRNALQMMLDDPENIYNWAQRYIGFKTNDQPDVLEEKFKNKISEYIEAELDEDIVVPEIEEDTFNDVTDEDLSEEPISATSGLDLLLEIIKLHHNKDRKGSGYTRPFDLRAHVKRLPYIISDGRTEKLNSKRLTTFLTEYRKYCDDEIIDYENEGSFYKFLESRGTTIDNPEKAKSLINTKWKLMKQRIIMLEKLEDVMNNSKIGMIEVKDLTPSDSQKIFNIINSEGEKLTSVEIMSAKPHWNIPVDTPSSLAKAAIENLYKQIGTVADNVVKWDYPATFVSRLGENFVLKKFSKEKSDFEKELTLGFKLLSGIYTKGVKKENIEELGKLNTINWSSEIDTLINDIKTMLRLIEGHDYFKYFISWNTSMMELTSDAIATNFVILSYIDWCRKGCPLGSEKAKQFQKNCFVLWDKLIFEYVCKQWRGSADNKIAYNKATIETSDQMFTPISEERWNGLLNNIFDNNQIEDTDISMSQMKPLLYHFYCLNTVKGPYTHYEIEVDHILPQTHFRQSVIPKKDIVQDNLLNLGLLPKEENTSKGSKRLVEITKPWLKEQILAYEFIREEDYQKYSDINNYEKLFASRRQIFINAYTEKRRYFLNN